ncbi:BREX-1 system adenine-specific DNA-methyltransferase PglX [Maricaulaceae bacterium MS644]
MDTSKLKKVAPQARTLLIDQVTVKLRSVLAADSAARRENPKAVGELETQIRALGEPAVIEKIAYTWFNRLGALRFMDANGLNPLRVVSPAEGQSQPQILAEAMAGHIDTATVPEATAKRVMALLSGAASSSAPQDEAYRLLLVAACNDWHRALPFLFEKIADYSELLMPSGLLAGDSVLARLREVMTEEACQDVEIIGWLYQFYISEKKDQVFAGLNKNQKITAENIPAATQLFTPHWIVRYLVENSLGRLWLLNRPGSRLAERMDYYIAPEEPETDFLKIGKPEEIKLCDPACGSGHMLTYAFDLLYAIYEEEGYDPVEIPALILTHNLTGVEIDDRAGALAAFALAMKAAAKLGRRRFLRMEVKPGIVVLQNVAFSPAEMQDVAAVVGRDLFTDEFRETLLQFEQAKNYGSLIVPKLRDPAETLRVVEARDFGGDLLLKEVQERVVAVLRMAEALSPKYHVVVANPPYMGGKGMNPRLKNWLKEEFPAGKSDLMTCFMERCFSLNLANGYWSMINLPSWMFLGSYEDIRRHLLKKQRVTSLLQLGRGLFGPDFGTVAFTVQSAPPKNETTAVYRRLFENQVNVRRPEEIERLYLKFDYNSFRTHQRDLLRIPSTPMAYWLSDKFTSTFSDNASFNEYFTAKQGLATGNNDRFVRSWHEPAWCKTDCTQRLSGDFSSTKKWFPYSKGGEARKWYGNHDLLINWENNGEPLKEFKDHDGNRLSTLKNLAFMFRPAITWSLTSISGILCTRFRPNGFVFDTNGMSAFSLSNEVTEEFGVALLNSRFAQETLKVLNPTMAFQSGDIDRVPVPGGVKNLKEKTPASALVRIAKSDWDAFETSWDFTTLPLLSPDHRGETLKAAYARLRAHWQGMTDEMKRLEEENNRIFIDAYGLQDELTPEAPIEEITLTCNPAYRYGVKTSADDREKRLEADTMREFLSYAVGCMFGRYSLDEPGLILANQGETLEDYLKRVPQPTFLPDDDNVIPILDGDWFPDDITGRFRKFLRVTFGDDNFAENLRFIEDSIGKDLRKFFLRDFYDDHVRRYKKRPIYWMFSSPKGSFNALIYVHRYRSDTVSVVLNEYLREYIKKLEAHRAQQQSVQADPGAGASAQTKAAKEIDATAKILAELEAYERDVLYPLATQRVEIDLDDGVKANYPKFGAALKPIKGLSD